MEKQDEDSTETYCIIEPKVEIEDLSDNDDDDYKDFIIPKEELCNSDAHSADDDEQTIDIYVPVKTELALDIEMVKFQSEASSENSDSSHIHRVKFKPITDEKRAEIVALFEQNVAISEIGRRLKISRRTVQLWVHRYMDSGHVNARRPGPPARSYTDASRRHQDIVATFRKHPLTRITATAKRYNISTETVRKHLIAAGLRNCKKPCQEALLNN